MVAAWWRYGCRIALAPSPIWQPDGHLIVPNSSCVTFALHAGPCELVPTGNRNANDLHLRMRIEAAGPPVACVSRGAAALVCKEDISTPDGRQ